VLDQKTILQVENYGKVAEQHICHAQKTKESPEWAPIPATSSYCMDTWNTFWLPWLVVSTPLKNMQKKIMFQTTNQLPSSKLA
jgi:hypothetical protein